MWIDNDFPKILGAELYRPHPAYVVEMAVDPVVVHDFGAQPGQTVALDRYRYWGNPGTKDSRERTADQTLGTASSRNIVKDKVNVTLKELAQALTGLFAPEADVPALAISSFAA
jgi:hypothetical protein